MGPMSSVLGVPFIPGGHDGVVLQTIETFPLAALAVQCPLLAVATPFPAVAELVPDVTALTVNLLVSKDLRQCVPIVGSYSLVYLTGDMYNGIL